MAPSAVAEGGRLRIEVYSNVKAIQIYTPGQGVTWFPVVNGVVEYHLPSTVPAGSPIYITDGLYPNPSSAVVTVVGG